MALIGKECLNCGTELDEKKGEVNHKKGSHHPLCNECEKVVHICPKCDNKENNGIIQGNFNYFMSCSKCGYYGRPLRNTQLGNHPFDYVQSGHIVPENKEQAETMKVLLRKEKGMS